MAASALVAVPQESGLQLWTGLDTGSLAVFEVDTGGLLSFLGLEMARHVSEKSAMWTRDAGGAGPLQEDFGHLRSLGPQAELTCLSTKRNMLCQPVGLGAFNRLVANVSITNLRATCCSQRGTWALT